MAIVKNSRADGRRLSLLNPTFATISCFAVCLLAIWLYFTTQAAFPARKSVTFVNDLGDYLLEGGIKGDGITNDPKNVNVKEDKIKIADGKYDLTNKEDKNQDENIIRSNTYEVGKQETSAGMENIENIHNPKDKDSTEEQDDHESKMASQVGDEPEFLNEASTDEGTWSTQEVESWNEKILQESLGHDWKTCNVTAGPDYIPCLDNWQAIKRLRSTMHYEHRERHCPEEPATCLVPLPKGYKRSIKWPESREKIWYNNVPHTKLATVKRDQNWIKVDGEYLTFPGGGTQFKHGAQHYVDFIQNSLPDIAWGSRTRVILDVGCGVGSFGGYLLERDVIAMSMAPKDEHEAQVQFALERGIPAILGVMGTKRLPFPGSVFDIIHCARCRVPWHIEGGMLLLELNRLLRPGGYFVWSATPVYQKLPEDVEIWKAMSEVTKSMCWDLLVIKKDKVNKVGIAIYKRPTSNDCYYKRAKNEPPICQESDDPHSAWNALLKACMHKIPEEATQRGSKWPEKWPERLELPPYWLTPMSVSRFIMEDAQDEFLADSELWKDIVSGSYLNRMGIDWSHVRNVMDMKAKFGGFAAALKELKVWTMNVVHINSANTLPIIYDRGLIGVYHDWCESFNTYPRTYDLLHADHLFSNVIKRCKFVALFAEVDRILRPGGNLIVRDNMQMVREIENLAKSLHWEVKMVHAKDDEGLLCVQKTFWRPSEKETIISAIW